MGKPAALQKGTWELQEITNGVSQDAAAEKAKLAWKHINKHLLCKPWQVLTQP